MATHKLPGFPSLLLLLAAVPRLLDAQTVTVSTSPHNPSTLGTPVTITATISPSSATGLVTFLDGVAILGTAPVVSGTASFSTTMLPIGIRKLRAYYGGNASTAAATSSVFVQTVNAQPSASFAARSLLSTTVASVFGVADLNGDGKADLIVNDGTAATIGVLLGDGNGHFQPAANTNLGSTSRVNSVAVGDFNGDGKADLVVAIENNLKILPGNGDGTFQAPVSISFPGPDFVAVSDFNGDGKADLVALNGGGVSILPGNGDGTFQAPLQASSDNVSVVIADFNGDGKADLATTDGNTLHILLGKGDGTFQPAITYPMASNSLVAGDFNQDGKPDLAVIGNNTVCILLSKGDSTFQSPVCATGVGSFSATVGDFNGDGMTDLVLFGGVTVLAGNGDGTFQPPVNYPTAFATSPLFVGEFNGDGRTDLVLGDGNFLLGTTVSVTPVSGTPQSTVAGSPFPSPLQVTVMDGANPVSGVAVTYRAPSVGATATLANATTTTDASGGASAMATANNLEGSYTATATALGVTASFLLTNLVGPPSVITSSPTSPQSALLGAAFPKPLQVKLTDAAGNPATGVSVMFTAPSSGASAVVSSGIAVTDASGVASVTAVANIIRGSYKVTASFGGLSATFSLTNLEPTTVTLGTSANPSTFGAPLTLTATVTNPSGTGRVTFFDGVALLGTKPVSSGTATLSTILLPAGNRTLTAYYRDDANSIAGTSNIVIQTVRAVAGGVFAGQSPLSVSASSVAVGDFNGDGKVDFAFANGVVTVLLGKGDGTFQPPVNYPAGSASAIAAGMTEPRAEGEAFNIGDPKPVTQFELVEKLARAANVEPVLARVPRDAIVQAGGNAMQEPYYFGEYLDLPPITENIGKVTRVLKMKLTPFEVGLKETYRWYLRNHKPRTAGFEFDDRLLAMSRTGSTASV